MNRLDSIGDVFFVFIIEKKILLYSIYIECFIFLKIILYCIFMFIFEYVLDIKRNKNMVWIL